MLGTTMPMINVDYDYHSMVDTVRDINKGHLLIRSEIALHLLWTDMAIMTVHNHVRENLVECCACDYMGQVHHMRVSVSRVSNL